MSKIDFYKKTINCNNEDAAVKYFMDTLKPSILLWTYFVNWDKVKRNVKEIEVSLNTMNYLIGKKDFDNEFRMLLKQHPEVIHVIPSLLVRDGKKSLKFKILVDYQSKKFIYNDYDFTVKKVSTEDIERILEFVTKTGLKELLVSGKIKNLVDYTIGVEAGIDSNGRKNRSGTQMETIVEYFVKDLCNKKRMEYLPQANAQKAEEKFKVKFPAPNKKRLYDFVIYDGKRFTIIETNYYSDTGGSKIKAVAGEFSNMFQKSTPELQYIWITDGLGWKSTINPFKEAFHEIDYILNLSMIEKGMLEELI